MKKILIIGDDDGQSMNLLEFLFKKHEYEVIKAMKGQDGLRLALEEKIDIILTNWQLLDMNTIKITKEIWLKDFYESPIVLDNSNALVGDKEKAFKVGATGYIEKPINPKSFLEELNKLLINK